MLNRMLRQRGPMFNFNNKSYCTSSVVMVLLPLVLLLLAIGSRLGSITGKIEHHPAAKLESGSEQQQQLEVVLETAQPAPTLIGSTTSSASSSAPAAVGALQGVKRLATRRPALTGLQWMEELKCKPIEETTANTELETGSNPRNGHNRGGSLSSMFNYRLPLSNLWNRLMSECNRDNFAWRYRYADELKPSFNYQVKDETIDERLANILYTISLNNMFDSNYFTFNSGRPDEDEKNELRVAGSQVDDSRCHEELAIMSSLYDELQDTLARFRTATSVGASSELTSRDGTTPSLSLEERHIRLARVLDSFGRYESGSLDGRLLLAGSYDECIGSQLTTDGKDTNEEEDTTSTYRTIQMRYCWASMNFDQHLNSLLKNRKKFNHETAIPTLNVAICLPKSCHSKSLHSNHTRASVQKLVSSQMTLPRSMYVSESFQLDSVFCLVDADSEWGRIPASGKMCLLFGCLWTFMCLMATCANKNCRTTTVGKPLVDGQEKHTLTNQNQGQNQKEHGQSVPARSFGSRVCNCLDLVQSWRDFTSDKRQLDSGAPKDLDVLNPIKVIACAFCVISHTALVFGSVSAGTGQIAAYFDTSPLLMSAILNSTVVDTFFVMSGLLVTYISLQKLAIRRSKSDVAQGKNQEHAAQQQSSPIVVHKRGTQKGLLNTRSLQRVSKDFLASWLVLALNRYLRIVPLYALLFWFRRDVLSYLGSGPLWDHGLNRNTANGACLQEPWYTPFTFATAFKQVSKQCYVPSWSISNDIFFALALPPLILMFHNKPSVAIGSTIFLTLASLLAALETLASSFPPSLWELLELKLQGIILLSTDMSALYTWPLYRASSILVGSLAGYGLFKYERNHGIVASTVETTRIAKHTSDSQHKLASSSTPIGWPNWLTGPATRLSFLYLMARVLLTIVANDLKNHIAPYHRLLTCYIINVDRVIWSLANAVLFLQMMTSWRHNSWMQSFSSQKWRTLAKLNYAILFVHWILIVVYMGALPASPIFTLWHIFAAFSMIFVGSLALSTLIHVIFENPLDKLVKRLIFH